MAWCLRESWWLGRALLALVLALSAGEARAQQVVVQVEGAPPPPPTPPRVVVSPPPPPAVGARVSVAPPPPPRLEIGPIDLPFRFAVEALFGFTNMHPAVDGSTFGLGLQLELAPIDWLALGVRGGWSITSDVGLDLDQDGRDDVEDGYFDLFTITAGPRFRIPTAPSGHDAIVIELGAGFAYVPDGRRPAGAVLELALSRWGDAGGAGGGPVLRLQQGLGDAGSLTTVLVGVQGGLDTRPSAGISGRSDVRYTFGVDLGLGGGFLEQGLVSHGFAAQLGMSLGVPLGDVIEPRVRADFGHRVAGQERDGLETYGVGGSLRLLLDLWAPLYLEAGGGWAFRFGTRAPDVPGGAFLDVGAGARFAGCDGDRVAWTVGARGRIGLVDSDALSAIYGTLGVEYDSRVPGDRPRCRPPEPEPEPVEVASHAPAAPPSRPVVVAPPPSPPTRPVPQAPAATARAAPPPRVRPESPPEPSGPTRIPLRIGLEPLAGLADSALSMEGPMAGAALTLGVAFDRHFGLDLRLAALGGPAGLGHDPVLRDHVDVLGAPSPFLLSVGAGPRFMVWSDEDSRLGWSFELSGSYAYLEGSPERRADPTRIGLHGGLLELAVGPQLGARSAGGFAFDFGLVLRLQQGLGDLLEYRAVLVGLRLGLEADTPEPDGAPDRPAAFQYTIGGQIAYGLAIGASEERGIRGFHSVGRASMHFGLPIGRWLEVRARGGVGPRGVAEERSMWTLDVTGGARLRFDEVFPLYVEAGAGYAFQYGATALQAPTSAIVDVGLGARFTDCTGSSDGALEIGIGARFGVEQDRTLDALMVTVGYEYAGGRPMFERNERWHCRQGLMRQYSDEERAEMNAVREAERREAERRAEAAAAARARAMPPAGTMGAGGAAGATIVVPAPTTPTVEVGPRTYEVVVGIALGPGLEVRLVPEMLPLAVLAGAGHVQVELVGPAHALPRAEAELRATFGARGLRLDAVTRVGGWDPTVRARITVWPRR